MRAGQTGGAAPGCSVELWICAFAPARSRAWALLGAQQAAPAPPPGLPAVPDTEKCKETSRNIFSRLQRQLHTRRQLLSPSKSRRRRVLSGLREPSTPASARGAAASAKDEEAPPPITSAEATEAAAVGVAVTAPSKGHDAQTANGQAAARAAASSGLSAGAASGHGLPAKDGMPAVHAVTATAQLQPANGGSAAHEKVAVPFTPVALVCRDLRYATAGRPASHLAVRAVVLASIGCSYPLRMPLRLDPRAGEPAPAHAHQPLSVCLPRFLDLAGQAGTFNHLIAPHLALPCSYYVPDPSRGEAAGVVKGSEDRDISGKLELLKGGPIIGCNEDFLRGPRPRFVTGQGLLPAAHRPAQHCIQAGEALSSPCPSSAAPCPVPHLSLLCRPLPSPTLVPPMRPPAQSLTCPSYAALQALASTLSRETSQRSWVAPGLARQAAGSLCYCWVALAPRWARMPR